MKKTILYLVLATLCLFFKANAQFYKPSDKTVRMGETLPDSFYHTIHQAVNTKTGKRTTFKLSQYKDKLIILDFWATWCGPCIYSLSKLDSLQKAMKNDAFIIIPVTYQSEQQAKTRFDEYKWDMTSIVNDTLLAQIFPHNGIPHQAWIQNGKVISFPWWTYATESNILTTLNGNKPSMILNIQDRMVDPAKPIFVNGNGETGIYYRAIDAVIARFAQNYRSELTKYIATKDSTFLYCVNNSIAQLFYGAFKDRIFPVLDMHNGIVWEINETLKNRIVAIPALSMDGEFKKDSIRDQWFKDNMYGYSLRHPKVITENKALSYMQHDLSRFFGLAMNLSLEIKKFPKKYLVLRTIGPKSAAIDLLKNNGEKTRNDSDKAHWKIYNRAFGEAFLLHLKVADPVEDMPIIDSTGIDHQLMVDFITPKKMRRNLKLTQEALIKYGLSIKEEELMVPMLAVTETPQKNADFNQTVKPKNKQ